MARSKAQALSVLVLTVLLIGPAAALEFNIEVNGVTDAGIYDLSEYRKGKLIEINATAENFGSVGCKYRLRADFNRSDRLEKAWSREAPVWPGGSDSLSIIYTPFNYTGEVPTEVYLEYCGLEKRVGAFNFSVNNSVEEVSQVDSRVVRSNSSAASVRTGIKDGYLVPLERPAAWKVSSARVKDSRAELDYSAPLFTPEKKVSYLVVNSQGEAVGRTEFDLEPEITLVNRITRNAEILALAASLLANIILLVILFRKGYIADKLKL